MGDRNNGAAAVNECGEERHHFRPRAGILSERRFVENENLRASGKHRGHAQPPLFTAGQGKWIRSGEVIETQSLEQFVDPGGDLGGGHTQCAGAHLKFRAHSGGQKLVFRILEYRSDARQ